MNKPIIGSIEQVQIPLYGDKFVLAKVDTGADSSAIWATVISQDDGVLSYMFFGPGSNYYTGEIHTTKKFQLASIKNSFGSTEIRYKIRLKIIIGDHEVTSWFTLADRSRNSYPILIGKKLLKDSFIVDVAKRHVHSDRSEVKKVLVTSSNPGVTQPFLDEVEAATDGRVSMLASSFDDILFDINGEQTLVYDTLNNVELTQYDLTYFKSHWKFPEMAAATAEYLTFKNKPFIDKEVGEYTSRSKLSEMMRLATHSLPVPRAFVGRSTVLKDHYEKIVLELGFPLVLKDPTADKGKDNYIVDTKEEFFAILDKTDAELFIAQKYIQNDGFYRLNIFGDEVKLAVYRSSHPHKNPLKRHLNKPSGGANASKIEVETLPSNVLEIAVRAALCLGRQVAGADILQDKETNEWYILEVNSSPQLRTGAYPDEKITAFAKFIERRLER